MGSLGSFEDAVRFLGYVQKTVYDQLDEAGRSWAIYAGDVPQSILLVNVLLKRDRLRPLACFYEHAARAERDFPEYAFIEPRYFAPDQNDDHPPHDAIRSQELIASVYNAIRANEALWNSTLLIVLYDEHGGFYDHVAPPLTSPPDNSVCREKCQFDRLGVRVPAVLVSPWVDKQVLKAQLDHTSILKYLSEKWGLEPLTARVAASESFAPAIRAATGTPRTDAPGQIIMRPLTRTVTTPAAALSAAPSGEIPLNENQKGLVAFMEHVSACDLRANRRYQLPVPDRTLPSDPEAAKSQFRRLVGQARAQSQCL